MITIKIDNSFSQIEGLTALQEKELAKILSYTEDAKASYYRGGFGPRRIPLISKRGEFPTGLLAHTYGYLVDKDLTFKTIALNHQPATQKAFKMAPSQPKPYPAQAKAVETALAAHRGTLSMPTGTGKSLVIAHLIARLGLKALVVVPTLEIKEQLKKGLLEALGPKCPVVVENIGSSKLKNLTDFDVLIIDEAHHVAAKTYRNLNKTAWKGIYYRFFMTATPFRSNANENILFETIAGDIVYELTYVEAIRDGYIVPVEAYYYDLPKVPVDGDTWAQVYKELIVTNEYRNTVIANMLQAFHEQKVSTLCLVKEVDHGKRISDISGAALTHGLDEESRQYIQWFNQGKLQTLVATSGMAGEGIDTKPCEYVIIAGLGKAKSQFMQQVGRAVRKYPGKASAKIIIFRDPSHKFTLNHFNAQKKILLDEYGVKLIKLTLGE